jgi:hypothetical protein
MPPTGESLAVSRSTMELSRWLLEEQALSVTQLGEAKAHQRETGTPLSMALIEMGLLDEQVLVEVVARRSGLSVAPQGLHRRQVPQKALSALPQDLCWQYGVFPFAVDDDGRLQIAIVDPCDEEAMAAIKEHDELEPEFFVVGPRSLEKAIRKHYLDGWVEDSRGKAKNLRFFGYDNITSPGVALRVGRDPEGAGTSMKGPVTVRPAGPARPPSPRYLRARKNKKKDDASEGKASDPAASDDGSVSNESPLGRVPVSRSAGKLELMHRVARLEEAVGELLELLSQRADASTQKRITEILAKLR